MCEVTLALIVILLLVLICSCCHREGFSLTGARSGLGSIHPDPRFEPGQQVRHSSGDSSPSHGGHAGHSTLGAYGSSKFAPTNNWLSAKVRGFDLPEKMYTSSE